MELDLFSLEKRIRTIWLVIGGICFALACIVLGIIIAVGNEYLLPILISGIIVLLILGLLCFGYPILKYKFYKYGYNDRKIIINKGVIFRHRIIVPVCQIQDLHIYQGPIMTIFKLSGVIISTAGSNYIINGISNENAKKMVQDLENDLQKRIEDINNETLH